MSGSNFGVDENIQIFVQNLSAVFEKKKEKKKKNRKESSGKFSHVCY